MKKAFVGLALSAVLLALSFPSEAQQAKKILRIGFLVAGSPSSDTAWIQAFQQGLRELGETCMALGDYAKERLGHPLAFPG
ncbi:MAG: hypothetical protein U1E51_32995, partial [Candidatus Binatia bacterium]|nr:hypothetical protein [Candidatus Binatia bacterium]